MNTTNAIPAGFTSGIFGNMAACEDFIWSYLYDNGLQYHTPETLPNGQVKLIYECSNELN